MAVFELRAAIETKAWSHLGLVIYKFYLYLTEIVNKMNCMCEPRERARENELSPIFNSNY